MKATLLLLQSFHHSWTQSNYLCVLQYVSNHCWCLQKGTTVSYILTRYGVWCLALWTALNIWKSRQVIWLTGISCRYLGKGIVTDNPKYLPKCSHRSKPESLSNFLAYVFIEKCLIHPPIQGGSVPFLAVTWLSQTWERAQQPEFVFVCLNVTQWTFWGGQGADILNT